MHPDDGSAIADVEADYRYTLELSPQVPWTADAAGNILEAGPRWMQLTGMAREETLGTGWLRAVHPDDVPPTIEIWSRSLATGEPVDARYRLRTPEGDYRWFRARAAARRGPDGAILKWYGVVEDIDDQVHSEVALRDTERRLQAVLNNASVAIFLMDEAQHCVYMNAAAEQLTGYTLAETSGRTLHDVIHHSREDGSPYPIEDCPIDRVFPENNNIRGEDVLVHKDGHFFPVAYTASPIRDHASRTVGTIVEVQDITERRRAGLELERAQQSLLRTSRLSAVGAMASTLAHELNQPLTAVSNFVAVASAQLAGIPEAAHAVGSLELAGEQALRAGEIIRRIRSFTMTGELRMSEEDLSEIIDLERRQLEQRIRVQRIAIKAELAPGSRRVLVDVVQIRQVIGNILRNAVDEVGGTRRPQIRITASAEGGFARVAIEDNGPGSELDDLEQLFLPFSTGKTEGLGLGLPVCRTIVEAHGGTIRAERSTLGGLRFVLTLPLADADA